MNGVDDLQRLGFGEYESRAYVALLQHDALNGYELARAAGVPRPNIYGVLQKLEDRGAVLRVDTPTGVRYSAVAPEELLRGMSASFQDALSAASDSLTSIRQPRGEQYAWNLSGYSQVMKHAHAILETARFQVAAAIRPQEARALSAALQETQSQGMELTTLCLQGCPEECGHCHGHVHRYPVETGEEGRWLVIVVDGVEMLAGEMGPGETAWAVRSRQPFMVDMATWYVSQTISHSAVLSDLAGREDRVLSPETLALLESRRPRGFGARFAQYVRRLLDKKGEEKEPSNG